MSPRPYITSKTQSSISSFPSSSSVFRTQLRRQLRRESESRSSEEVGLDTYQPKAVVQGYSWVLVVVVVLPQTDQLHLVLQARCCCQPTDAGVLLPYPPLHQHIAISRNNLFLLRQRTLYASAADTCRPDFCRYHVATKTMHVGAGRCKRSVTTCLSNACASQDFEMRYEASATSEIQGLCRLQITCSCFS